MTPIIDVLCTRTSNIRVKNSERGRSRTFTSNGFSPWRAPNKHPSLPLLSDPRGQAFQKEPRGSFLCFAGHFQTAPWPIFLDCGERYPRCYNVRTAPSVRLLRCRVTSAVLARALEPRSASSDWPQERWSFWQAPDQGFLSLRQGRFLTSIRRRRGLFYVPPWTSVCGFAFPCRLRASAKTITEVRTSNLRTRPEGRPNPTLLVP